MTEISRKPVINYYVSSMSYPLLLRWNKGRAEYISSEQVETYYRTFQDNPLKTEYSGPNNPVCELL